MDEQDLDRDIDTVTAGMVEGEPSPALGRAVMARVRGSKDRRPARRVLWATAAAGVVLCGVIAAVILNRTPAAVPEPTQAAAAVVEPPAETPRASVPRLGSAPPAVMTLTRHTPSSAPLDESLSSIGPIAVEPLMLPSIEVLPLEHKAASLDRIEIEPLTIEPLSASND